MASNYVRISSSVADILMIANNLRGQGRSLKDKLQPVIWDITTLEGDPDTFPRDDFTNDFMKNYEKDVPDNKGDSMPTNVAVKMSALSIGDGLIGMGDFVAGAMWNYQGQDDDNAQDIGSAKA